MTAASSHLQPTLAETSVFARAVCGIDESLVSLVAAKQARRLVGEGELTLVAVADVAKAVHAGFHAVPIAQQIAEAAEHALSRACASVPAERVHLVRGRPESVLLHTIASSRATLVALGATLHGRVSELVIGSVGSAVLRNASCSVLLARPPRSDEAWPTRILLGVDGSAHSERAAALAGALSRRFDASLRVLSATGGKATNAEFIHDSHPAVEIDSRPPVDALVDPAWAADLVIVGSRGLHGWRALGSVSERVAQRCHASVLVVRGQECSLAAGLDDPSSLRNPL